MVSTRSRRQNGQSYFHIVFVRATSRSALTKFLQVQQAQNNHGRTHWFRIADILGGAVRNIIVRNYSWALMKCKLQDCLRCSTCPDLSVFCKKPDLECTITCLKCIADGLKLSHTEDTSKTCNTNARCKIIFKSKDLVCNGYP